MKSALILCCCLFIALLGIVFYGNHPTREISLTFGDKEFSFPRNTLDGWENEANKNDALMLYALPDYRPWRTIPTDEKEQLRRNGYWGQMLLENEKIRPSIETMVKNRRAYLTKEEKAKSLGTLDGFNWYHRRKDSLKLWSTVYIEKGSEGNIISFIECSSIDEFKKAENSVCSHKFTNDGILYQISYNQKRYLSHWEAMRQTAIDHLKMFKIIEK